MNPFELLGVPPTASDDEITAAYRRLAQIFHPDRLVDCSEPVRREAERLMLELNRAYATVRRGGRSKRGHAARTAARATTEASPSRVAGVPWDLAAQARVSQAVQAERVRQAKLQEATHGRAVVRPKVGRRELALAGLGEALHTNNVRCRTCGSVQWLPDGWRTQLDDMGFYCSFCNRLLLAR